VLTSLQDHDNAEAWCKINYLSYTSLQEVELVKVQIQSMMESAGIKSVAASPQELETTGFSSVRRALVCGFFMQTAKVKSVYYWDAYSTVMTGQVIILFSFPFCD
jgi:hypothetical protein